MAPHRDPTQGSSTREGAPLGVLGDPSAGNPSRVLRGSWARGRSLVRASLRAVALAFVSGGLWVALRIGSVALVPFPSTRRSFRARIVRAWGSSGCWLLGIEVAVEGTPPGEPGFLVCNHLGYLDILVLARSVDATFVAKSEIAGWPFLGFLARSVRTIFVDRTKKRDVLRVNRAIEDALRDGSGVILFPEGTSSRGLEVLPFKPSLLQPATGGAFPIRYASITYRIPDNRPSAAWTLCWWGDMGFASHFWRVLELQSSRATLHFGEEVLRGGDRKILAETLHGYVTNAFQPVAQ